MENAQTENSAAGAASASDDGLGAAVIVRGQVVAWFADFTEEAREWCTENHFGEWLTWRAKPPEIVPLTEAEYDEAMRKGAELAARLNDGAVDRLRSRKVAKVLAATVRTYAAWIRQEGMNSDTCTFHILGEVCEYCECKRKPSNK